MINESEIINWGRINLQYNFNDLNLLIVALTHPSYELNKQKKLGNYERLEFLGDSVLNMFITEQLLKQYPTETEGELARRRAALVCKETLSQIAVQILIPDIIIMSEGEKNSGGNHNPNNLENCLEAIVGAIYIDGGFTAVQDFIKRNWYDYIIQMNEPPKDPKSALQEWTQKNHQPIPEYNIIDKHGQEHQPIFTIEIRINKELSTTVEAKSRKIGERMAAQKLLEIIQNNSKNEQKNS